MSAWMQISSGRGPSECGWVVARLIEALEAEASRLGLSLAVLEVEEGEPDTLRSALVSIEGEGGESFVDGLVGTVQWIGPSPFRPRHKRRNWFVT